MNPGQPAARATVASKGQEAADAETAKAMDLGDASESNTEYSAPSDDEDEEHFCCGHECNFEMTEAMLRRKHELKE